jgi:hypothetical protein
MRQQQVPFSSQGTVYAVPADPMVIWQEMRADAVIFKEYISEAKVGLPLPQIYTSIDTSHLTAKKKKGRLRRAISIQQSDGGNKLLLTITGIELLVTHVTRVQTVGQNIIRLLLVT